MPSNESRSDSNSPADANGCHAPTVEKANADDNSRGAVTVVLGHASGLVKDLWLDVVTSELHHRRIRVLADSVSEAIADTNALIEGNRQYLAFVSLYDRATVYTSMEPISEHVSGEVCHALERLVELDALHAYANGCTKASLHELRGKHPDRDRHRVEQGLSRLGAFSAAALALDSERQQVIDELRGSGYPIDVVGEADRAASVKLFQSVKNAAKSVKDYQTGNDLDVGVRLYAQQRTVAQALT